MSQTAGHPDDLVGPLADGDRRALARAITLVESTRPADREAAAALLDAVMERTGRAHRVGISGPPGVGKSTFVEALGTHLTTAGHRVAVLAVDPSSARSGGSILGDKTRMEALARDPSAFIRPSPAGGEVGGVARRTREAMLVCEAAGFDVVLVETVGVGQAELAVADMVDVFVVLAAPGSGDDLQGIKRGVMELADLVVVTKADGDLADAARHTAADIRRALALLRPRHEGLETETLLVSAHDDDRVGATWERMAAIAAKLGATGQLDALRADQARSWLWAELRAGVLERFRADPAVIDALAAAEAAVTTGDRSPVAAARDVLAAAGT